MWKKKYVKNSHAIRTRNKNNTSHINDEIFPDTSEYSTANQILILIKKYWNKRFRKRINRIEYLILAISAGGRLEIQIISSSFVYDNFCTYHMVLMI